MNNIADAVAGFIALRAERPNWSGLPAALRPTTIEEGYALQRAIHARLATLGVTRVGYKIGSTSAANQGPFGLREPVYAGIFDDTRAETLAAALARPMLQPSLECEIVFVLHADIDGGESDLSDAGIAEAVGSCHIGCEIIDRRYDDPLAVGVPSLIADDFFHAGFVVGAANPTWRERDLRTLSGVIEIDGTRASGNAADTLDAFEATRWLARKLATVGTRLRAGETIFTGTLPAPTPITLPARSVTLSITGFAPLSL